MLLPSARHLKALRRSRAVLAGLTAALLLSGAGSVQDATAQNETRTLSFYHTHSRERLTVTFKSNGRYNEAALGQLNHFLRDWRSQDKTTMDRRLFDILWEVYRDVDGAQPINIVSAYRSPSTNAMLRRRSSGVARSSQHMLGHAMDFYIPGVPLEKIRNAGLRLQRGGVGFYPTSGSPFVHLDTGNVRHWPRMTHDQLARVFPNGRTVHVPSNGGPLPGYQLALADQQRRGSSDSASSKPSLFASLFSRKQADDEDGPETAAPAAAPARVAAAPAKPAPLPVVAAVQTQPESLLANVPMPRAKPSIAMPIQLASAERLTALPAETPAPAVVTVATKPAGARFESPADIINARGFWDDITAEPKQATPAQVAAITARQAVAVAEPKQDLSEFTSAMAYAPQTSRPKYVTASAPMPRFRTSANAARPMAVTDVTTVVAKGPHGRRSNIVTAARMTASPIRDNDIWMRAMILSPSATRSMVATAFGASDIGHMHVHFVKPAAAVAMKFSNDPQLGLVAHKFTGSAMSPLRTTVFVRTASLR